MRGKFEPVCLKTCQFALSLLIMDQRGKFKEIGNSELGQFGRQSKSCPKYSQCLQSIRLLY